jgi:drug/metabolite transporter (DMT)-like permease
LMVAAGFGWGVYSLIGKRVTEPLSATAANFLLAAPFGLAAVLLGPAGPAAQPMGVVYGLLSGMGASGLGYALWYSVLPRIDASTASVAQLAVPVIAVAGGAVFLNEVVTSRLILAACVVLAGVALATMRRHQRTV